MKAKAIFATTVMCVNTILFLLLQTNFVGGINNLYSDTLQGSIEPRQEIVIVGIDDKSLQEIGSWPWDRSVFSEALEKIDSSNPSVIGMDVLFLESRSGDSEVSDFLSSSQTPVVMGSKLIDNQVFESIYKTQSGFVNFDPDSDGKIRTTQVYRNINGKCEPSFSIEIVSIYFGVKDNFNCTTNLKLRTKTYNLSKDNTLRFAYTNQKFKVVSFSDLLDPNFSYDFKDKVVLIGSTALDLRSNLNDNFTDIFGDSIPGIEIHANIINSFLNETFYTNLNIEQTLAIFLITNTLLLALSLRIKKIAFTTLIFLVALVCAFLISLVLVQLNILLPLISILVGLVANYLIVLLYKYLTQSKETRFIKNVFSRYLNENLLKVLLEDSSKLRLGGEERNMTVMFSDIRGFTTISEGLTPTQLINLINDYLSFMSDIILKYNGTIDKYIGDAIMALWNAPITDENHSVNAVKTAIAMKESLDLFKKTYPNYPEINIGIGINTGQMTAGNVGGEKRFDYTVLGDNVNLASRLEGLTKKYAVTTIVTESTKTDFESKRSSNEICFRLLDEVIVKGKNRSIKIFEPYKSDDESSTIMNAYEEAFKLYQSGDFVKALKVLKKNIADKPSQLLIERINSLTNEQKQNWNGVWKWEDK